MAPAEEHSSLPFLSFPTGTASQWLALLSLLNAEAGLHLFPPSSLLPPSFLWSPAWNPQPLSQAILLQLLLQLFLGTCLPLLCVVNSVLVP